MPTDKMISEIEEAVSEIITEENPAEEGAADEKANGETAVTKDNTEETQAVATGASQIQGEEGGDGTGETGEGKNLETEESSGVGGPAAEEGSAPVAAPISDALLARAVQAGISLSDARNAYSEESLERIVTAMEATDSVADEVESEAPEDPFADLPKLDPEVHDPATIAKFDQLTEIVKQQHNAIQTIESRQEEASLIAEEEAADELTQWFDRQVSGLGEEFSEALGSGSHDSLKEGSPQLARRNEIAHRVGVLHAGHKTMGDTPPPRDELFDMAARSVLRDEYQKKHEKELAGNLGKRASQHINRVNSQKTTGTETPEEAAAAALKEQFGI